MGHAPETLFYIGPLAVNSFMVTMAAITVLLVVASVFATCNMKKVPGGLQNLAEKIVEMLDNFFGSILSSASVKKYGPLLSTFFLFILISNYSGLLPLAGSLPGLAAPTSSLSVTVALAIMIFVLTQYHGIRTQRLGYFKSFFKPYAFIFPLLIIEEIVRPVSMSLRLYGNIFGEETVTHQIFEMVPLLVPIIMNVFSLLMGFVQAMVFVLLACIYIDGAESSH